MSFPDPFEDKSPWDEDNTPAAETSKKESAPVTTEAIDRTTAAPFKIGFTLKSASGFEAEWLTPAVYGHTAEETAQRGAALLVAMKDAGLIELASKAAQFTRDQYKGASAARSGPAPKKFENGRVTPAAKKAAPARGKPKQHDDPDACQEHGEPMTYKRTGNGKELYECAVDTDWKNRTCPTVWVN